MITMTETPLETKTAIHAAVSSIAVHCDGANTEDGIGFNGSDTKFGKRCSWLSPEQWTDGIAWEAYNMLAKYKGQLEQYGYSYDVLPVPSQSILEDGRYDARELAREVEAALSRTVSGNPDLEIFVIRFNYDAEIVSKVRLLAGAQWNADKKVWVVPVVDWSQPSVLAFCNKYEFHLDEAATALMEGVIEDSTVIAEDVPRRVTREDTNLLFEFDYDAHVVAALKEITGRRWDSKRKVWVIPQTSMEQVVAFAQQWDFDLDDSLEEKVEEIITEGKRREDASSAKDADIEIDGLGSSHPVTGVPISLHDFQKAGVAYAVDTKRCFIADEMGLGKTVQALASIQHQGTYPALVVCPASLKTNWQREVRMWLPGKTVHIVDNKVGVKNADVVVINYDILDKQKDALSKVGFQSLVFDESHYAKNKDTKRTKALKSLATSIPASGMVLALTGTPVLNRPIELVSQLEIIGRIEEFGGSWNFRKRYCAAKHNGYGWDFTGTSNADELNDLLRRVCYVRRNKADVLTELPAKGRYTVEAELSGQAMKQYRHAEADTLVWLGGEGRESNSAEHLSKITTLKRLAGEGKVEAACEWIDTFLDSTDRKLVVFAHHVSVVDAIAERYGKLRVAGKDSAEARQAAVDTFQNDPEHRVIVLNMKAGGVGLTLTSASDVLFVEQGWTPAEHDQAEDRCHRIGQEDNVSAWYLLAEGTIDDDIFALIEKKRVIVDAVTDGEDSTETSVLNDLVKTLIARADG